MTQMRLKPNQLQFITLTVNMLHSSLTSRKVLQYSVFILKTVSIYVVESNKMCFAIHLI